ncbi:DNA (cytosine-5-)-methyltransferase [Levilactobacillus tongjiangensis]|uniref:Cytosine-specific methyltransferase n=1 Tax=Levilactobacillus tongjiangensis TaxID=2486023 RepID=A0ABW1SQ34_9LACO|nr:DNA (cytosine-5-)-methyltransferase [Levilactobacillus tongjiangensis]
MQKRVAELFAGVGGFRVGLDKLNSGWSFVYANQWEPGKKHQYAFDCYSRHFGTTEKLSNEDINQVDKTEIPDMDLLVGGFPCQDYSVAHSGAKGIQGKKGVLWWDIRDTIEAKRPAFVLLENVDRLLSSPGKAHRGRDFGMILYTLNQLGYGAQWRVINAAEYGFPQRRRRVFIFAYRQDTNYFNTIDSAINLKEALLEHSVYNEALPINKALHLENETTLDGYIDIVDFSDTFSFHFENTGIMHNEDVFTGKYTPKYTGTSTVLNDIVLDHIDDDTLFIDSTPGRREKFEYLKGAKKEERTSSTGFSYYYSEGGMAFPDPLSKPGRTMLTSEHSVNRSTHVIQDKETGKLRLLSPLECERLQTFPDNWTEGMPKSSRYFMMGNALVCGLVTELGKGIDKIIANEDENNNQHVQVNADSITH